MRFFNHFALLLFFVGCSNMFVTRSFQEEMDRDSDGIWSANDDFPVVSGDTGKIHRSRRDIHARTPSSIGIAASERENEKLEEEIEARLDGLSNEERSDYNSHEKYLENNSEKVYYLTLSKAKRWTYISEKRGKALGEQEYSTLDYLKIRDSQTGTLELGMSKDDVMSKWGRPGRVDVAGDPRNENERWSFNQGKARKYIYFESGRVQGWSQD